MAALRMGEHAIPLAELNEVWPEALQRDRALDGLLVDGLVVGSPEIGYALP